MTDKRQAFLDAIKELASEYARRPKHSQNEGRAREAFFAYASEWIDLVAPTGEEAGRLHEIHRRWSEEEPFGLMLPQVENERLVLTRMDYGAVPVLRPVKPIRDDDGTVQWWIGQPKTQVFPGLVNLL